MFALMMPLQSLSNLRRTLTDTIRFSCCMRAATANYCSCRRRRLPKAKTTPM